MDKISDDDVLWLCWFDLEWSRSQTQVERARLVGTQRERIWRGSVKAEDCNLLGINLQAVEQSAKNIVRYCDVVLYTNNSKLCILYNFVHCTS